MRRKMWTICKSSSGRMEVATALIDGGEALLVFGFREEAEMYLIFRGLGTGWRVRETTRGRLISMLYGPCSRVERVALDAPPEVCRGMFALFDGTDRRVFLHALTRDRSASPGATVEDPGRGVDDGEGRAEMRSRREGRAADGGGAPHETVREIQVPDYAMYDLPALERASEAFERDANGGEPRYR